MAKQEAELEIQVDAVEATKVEQTIDDKCIGERIRRLRLRRSMGLVELGQRTGLSASFLSQLETGRVIPTIRNLAKIALVFDKDLAYFFRQDRSVNFRALRHSDRIRLTRQSKEGSRFISESMSSLVPDNRMIPCLAEFRPDGHACDFVPKVFAGIEFVYVLEGTLCLNTPTERQELNLGDVGWIDARTKRHYSATGADAARAMIVTFPQD